jgi:hypothetical protein
MRTIKTTGTIPFDRISPVMDDRNAHSTRRLAGLALALALAMGHTGSARAGECPGRPVPPYALQPPGASYEGYPAVGAAQAAAIAHEVVGATTAG